MIHPPDHAAMSERIWFVIGAASLLWAAWRILGDVVYSFRRGRRRRELFDISLGLMHSGEVGGPKWRHVELELHVHEPEHWDRLDYLAWATEGEIEAELARRRRAAPRRDVAR